MPGRYVHFAENTPVYTPSPSFTLSTLPSSGGPATPLSAYGTRYCSLPAMTNEVNPVLALAATPALSWNLVSPPQEVRPAMPSLSLDVLRQPATNPPLPFIRVVCSQLPWTLTITAQSGSFVTVGDFITGLYSCLRTGVTAEEFSRIPTHSIQNAVRAAYMNRCNLVVQMRAEEEKAKGVKRIDFLCQKVRFMGLSSTGKDETFKLSVA